jgi:lambda repressor-like predicted transcriptional regulator
MSLRINAGLSRADLALRAGVGRETLRLAEAGYLPGPRVQYAIAHALGCTPLDLWPIEMQHRPRLAA